MQTINTGILFFLISLSTLNFTYTHNSKSTKKHHVITLETPKDTTKFVNKTTYPTEFRTYFSEPTQAQFEAPILIPPKPNIDTLPMFRQKIVDYAEKFLGLPYIYGGTTPRGFDCSGFAQYIFRKFGYDITRVPVGQVQFGKLISKINDAEPGDLAFYGYPTGNGGHVYTHVGIVHSNEGGGNVKIIHSSLMGLVISHIHCDPSPRTQLICIKRVVE